MITSYEIPANQMEKLQIHIKESTNKHNGLINKLKINGTLNFKILDALPINIFLEDREGRTLFANEQACRCNGMKLEELVGKTVFDFFPLYIANQMRADDLEVWQRKELITKEVIVGFQGQEANMYTGKTIIHSEETDEEYLLGFGVEITERVQAEAKIEHMAFHDALTGLPNRWYIQTYMNQYFNRTNGYQQMSGVFLLDLDHFKVINDSFGHDAGDRLLQDVAKRLLTILKDNYTLARLGGDEFLLIAHELNNAEDTTSICDQIMRVMDAPFFINDQKLNVTTSIGVSLFPHDGDDINLLIKNADIAMYRSKDQGRNCLNLFQPAMNEYAMERMGMEIQLRRALEKNEFFLHYQPKINLITGKIYGVEALIRWRNSENVLVYPHSFIQIAEETGLIVPIGEKVLLEACLRCKEWHDQGLTHLSISVNLSALQFHKQDLEKLIARVLQETRLPAHALELELTESIVMKSPDEAVIVLRNLKNLGIKISIDDFGTGFSSLSYLQHFPIDILKIDKSFIMNLESNYANATIAKAVISLAHSLNLKVVAEGVENFEHIQFLYKEKCDYAQGYYISKPIDWHEMNRFLGVNK